MHRLTSHLLIGLAVLLWSAPVEAQWQYAGFAQITVDNTSGGVPFPASILTRIGHPFPTQAICALETDEIRWTVDGTAPTTAVGMLATAGSYLPTISGPDALRNFRAIREGAVSGVLSCSFFAGGVIDTPLSAGGGGGGGGGGSVTQGTDPWIISGTVLGSLANDTNTATTNRVPTLPCITLTSAPTWTNGRNAACRTFAGGGLATVLVNEAGTPYSFSTDDPCTSGTKVTYVVDIVTATTTEIANASVGNKLYVCSMNMVTAAANNVAIVEDDTDACATPTAGLNGGVTAGEGWNFDAKSGMVLQAAGFAHMETSTTNRYVCIITSAAVQLSGTIKYVLAP